MSEVIDFPARTVRQIPISPASDAASLSATLDLLDEARRALALIAGRLTPDLTPLTDIDDAVAIAAIGLAKSRSHG